MLVDVESYLAQPGPMEAVTKRKFDNSVFRLVQNNFDSTVENVYSKLRAIMQPGRYKGRIDGRCSVRTLMYYHDEF